MKLSDQVQVCLCFCIVLYLLTSDQSFISITKFFSSPSTAGLARLVPTPGLLKIGLPALLMCKNSLASPQTIVESDLVRDLRCCSFFRAGSDFDRGLHYVVVSCFMPALFMRLVATQRAASVDQDPTPFCQLAHCGHDGN